MSYKLLKHLRLLPYALVTLALLGGVALLSATASPGARAGEQAGVAPAVPSDEVVPAATPAPRPRRAEPVEDDDEDIDEEEIRERAWLGVTLDEIDEEGARIASVAEGSPADEAGLRRGDIIIGIDGDRVIGVRDVMRAVRGSSKGDEMRIRIERGGDERTINVTLGGRHVTERREFRWETPEPPEPPDAPLPPRHRGFEMLGSRNWLGVEILPMSDELRAHMKAPRDAGLLINRVVEDTPADEAGLEAGDVIIAVGGEEVSDAGDIGRALRDRDAGDRVAVRIVRDGSERTIDVEIEERPAPRVRRRGSFVVPRIEIPRIEIPAIVTPRIMIPKMKMKEIRPYVMGDELTPEERAEIEAEIARAMEEVREALEKAGLQIRERNEEINQRLRDEMERMERMERELNAIPVPAPRARTVHDI